MQFANCKSHRKYSNDVELLRRSLASGFFIYNFLFSMISPYVPFSFRGVVNVLISDVAHTSLLGIVLLT